MLQKLWHKKWMILCLLLGTILLIATVVSFPMYRNAAFDRMLEDEFTNHLRDSGEWPASLNIKLVSKKEAGGKTMKRVEETMNTIYDDMSVQEKETVIYYSLAAQEFVSNYDRPEINNLTVRMAYMSEFTEHTKMLYGSMYSEDGLDEDGNIEVVISQECMVKSRLLLGEVLQFTYLKDYEGNPISFKIVGIYDKAQSEDFYWQYEPSELNNVVFMNENLFREMFTGEKAFKFTITCQYFALFDYKSVTALDVPALKSYTDYLCDESPYRNTLSDPAYRDIIDGYSAKQDRIEATLFILQVPVLILLGAFLLMISSQMYDMERNEISVYKSRGASGGQIFRLYLYQSTFLALAGAVFGIPLGMLFCKLLGSARNFLEFDLSDSLNITITNEVLIYAVAAIVISILIMAIPALKHSRLTIVKLKQQKALKKKSWWEKCFLDIIILGVAIYGYYNFSKNSTTMAENVLQGESLDPLLYMSSSLFIVGLGLVFLRLQPLLIQLIYTLGKKHWKPASYASFTENIKNGRKQQFIMLFMILTVSLGMYHATVARTILQNAKDNAEYLSGADVVMKEVWTDNSAFAKEGMDVEFQYYEPDYGKYATLSGAKSYTKVINDSNANLLGKDERRITLMGIHTKEFGMNTYVKDGLLEKYYYEYLNELAGAADGVLVSRNFQSKLGYKIGDRIRFTDMDENEAAGRIVGFVDFWPAYEPTITEITPDGEVQTSEHYMVIAHYASLQQSWGTTPYEVWISLDDSTNSDDVYQWIQDNDIHVTKYENKEIDLRLVEEDPMLQGTNGVLTMGFIVTIILCAVGYLIYWIMSIRSREMMFGVLRACGMHKGELFHMLMNEQLFSGVLSILAGVGIGKLTSDMFVPMLQTAYQASNQVVPMQLITNPDDMVRLFGVIVAMMAVCMCVLIGLVFKLNVAKALKLGEE